MRKNRHLAHMRDAALKKEVKREASEPTAERKNDAAVVMGEAYSLDQLQELIANLGSDETALCVSAMLEFIDDNEEISEGAMDTTEYTKSDIAEAFTHALERNGEELIMSLESEGSVSRLEFVAESAYFPPELQAAAASALERLGVETSREPAESGAEPIAAEQEGRAVIRAVMANLESPDDEERVQACAGFLSHYSEVIQFASDEPLLTVTEVKEKLAQALSESPGEVIGYLAERGMSAELELLSKIKEAPEGLREQASESLYEIVEKAADAVRVVPEGSSVPELEEEEETLQNAPRPARPRITMARVEQLVSALESPEPESASVAVIEGLKGYDEIMELLSGNHPDAVKEFPPKLFFALASHLDLVFRILRERKEKKAVEFLILSPAVPASLRKRAMQLRRAMDHPEGERQ